MILAAIVIARNPAQYGFDFEPSRAVAYEKVTLPRPGRSAARRRVDRHDDRRIQALNPELRRWTTPVAATRLRP